jgi:chitinase
VSGFSVDATTNAAIAAGIPLAKLNVGVGFYGRGVVTNGPAALNAATVKRPETVQPDGAINTCADFTNWPRTCGTVRPTTRPSRQHAGLDRILDDNAKVPYKRRATSS